MEECDLSLAVADSEYVERAIGKEALRQDRTLRWQVFKLRPPETGASVIRQVIGNDEVKRHAKEIKKAGYVGVAEASVAALRAAGHDVVDHRRDGEFCGHADLHVGGEPAQPLIEIREPALASTEEVRRQALYKSLASLFVGIPEPDPESVSWTGVALGYT